MRRTSGVACTGAPLGRGAAGGAAASPSFFTSGADRPPAPSSSPITTSTVPTATTSPSATRIRATLPDAGDGISTVVLSVAISTSGSSSAISWPSCTSQRATSPSVRPSPRSGSLNSYATAAFLPESLVAEDGVHALRDVHDLRDAEIDADTRERKRLVPRDAELALHQIEHRRQCVLGREIEVLVEPEREPRAVGARDRRAQLEVTQLEAQHRTFERALDRGARDLAVALRAVAVAGHDERAVDRDRQVERRAGDELLAVDVPAPFARRDGRVLSRLRRRHADDAEKWAQRHTAVAELPRAAVEPPHERLAVSPRLAPRPGRHLVDVHDERLARSRAAHLERPLERMARTLGTIDRIDGIPLPARVARGERDRLARIDGRDGLVVAREPASHERGSCTQASAGASSRRRPIRSPSAPRNSQSAIACSSPSSRGATSAGTYPACSRRSASHTATAFGSCSFSGSRTSARRCPGANASSCSASMRYA